MNRSMRILFDPMAEGGAGGGAGGGGGAGAGAPVVPAEYKFAVPDGMTVDKAVVDDLTDFAKKGKFTQEHAQAVFDRELKGRKAAQDAAKPPDKYDFKPPQGVTVEQAVMDSLGAEYKALGLSRDLAQKLFERDLRQDSERVQMQETFLKEQQGQWKETMLKHPVYGGDKLTATAERSRRAVDRFAPPPIQGQPTFQEMLQKSTLGDHPYFVQFTANIGAAMEEGKIAAKGDAAGDQQKLSPDDRLRAFYEKQGAGAGT